jgi:hypothetical protein
MSYTTQRDALVRTPMDLVVVGVRECQNSYAATIAQLLQYTEQMDNAAWVKGSVTVTASNATAPDGTLTADTCVFNADNDTLDQVATGTAVTSRAFTFSVFLRVPSGSSTITIRCRNVANTEGTSKQVTVTTTWQRFYVHKLFTAVPVDDVQVRIVRIAGDTINGDIEVWGANLTRNPSDKDGEVPFPYVQRVTAAVNASTCSISDQGNGSRCFYSRTTCQDPDNFNAGDNWSESLVTLSARDRGIREYRFCKKSDPLPLAGTEVLPYIAELPSAAQEIDPERTITVNERATFTFEDDAGPGVWNARQQSDGMLVNTATGGGSFWPRWAAIYRNYSNPEGYLLRKFGYYEAAMTESDFQPRGRYLIRNYEYTSGRRAVLECGDRLRLTRAKIPVKISEDNTLQRRLSSSDVTAYVLDAGEFAPVADNAATATPDYIVTIQIDEEKMNVTAVDLTVNTLTLQRGRWGTAAAAHSRSTAIAGVAEFGTERSDTTLTPLGKNGIDIGIELLKYAGLTAAEIDTAAMQAERDYWMPSSVNATTGVYSGALMRRTLTDVTDVQKLLQEIGEVQMFWFYVTDDQMVTGRYYAPVPPTVTATVVTDDNAMLANTLSVNDHNESRISRALVAYHLPEGESADTPEDFEKIRIELTPSLEARDFYGDKRLQAVMSQWFQPVTASGISTEAEVVRYFTQRIVSRKRHGQRILTTKLPLQYDDLNLGDPVQVTTDRVQDVHGNPLSSTFYVAKKKREGTRLEFEFVDMGLSERAGFYNNTDLTVYTSASDRRKLDGYYSDDNGFVGSPKVKGYAYV